MIKHNAGKGVHEAWQAMLYPTYMDGANELQSRLLSNHIESKRY